MLSRDHLTLTDPNQPQQSATGKSRENTSRSQWRKHSQFHSERRANHGVIKETHGNCGIYDLSVIVT